MKNTGIKRLCIDALFASVALIIFVIELQIPNLTPIPGIKLGLANIVILLSLYLMGPVDALAIQLARILLGCLITGNMVSLAYSLTGGMLCLAVIIILKKFLNENQIWACSAAGAIFHNIGQIIDADYIYVLEQGRIVESGNPEDVYLQGGRYKEIFDASARSMNADRITDVLSKVK